jgi:hypothetical protein
MESSVWKKSEGADPHGQDTPPEKFDLLMALSFW